MVAHTLSSASAQKAEVGQSLEFEANLVYRASFGTARAKQRNEWYLKGEEEKNGTWLRQFFSFCYASSYLDIQNKLFF